MKQTTKQLVILSGKGGTGKTSVSAAFAHLASKGADAIPLVLADADVDAANLELVLNPKVVECHDFCGGRVALIDENACQGCGTCEKVCRFDAIHQIDGQYHVDPIACDGCAACVYQCPEFAIMMQNQIAGEWFRSESRAGTLFHAALSPGGENSGKLVTLVKQHARLLALDEGLPLMLVDGPPGIGCPVISAVSGADLALIVAEPTAAGVHDMRRVLSTTAHFGVKSMICVNKADLHPTGTDDIEVFARDQNIEVIGRIPFDLAVTKAMVQGQSVTAFDPHAPASVALAIIWQKIMSTVIGKER